jgi:uncharacterized protein YxeA
MKTIIIIAILLVLVIGIGVFFQSMLVRESRGMNTGLQETADLIREQKWEEAETRLRQISGQWQRKRKKWQAVSNHTEIGYIDESLARLEVFVSLQEDKDCLAEIAVLKQNIIFIPDKEKLTLSNIF